jgi:aspartate aminotransferase-like enzyme
MAKLDGRYIFKSAVTHGEIEQIHRLNYRTFVREIPQHRDPGSERLVDKFHDKSHYFIALAEERVIGMVSVHDRPPFSIAEKLEDPRVLERPGMSALEVRLLAIEPDARLGKIFAGLLWLVQAHARAHGNTHLLISGLAEREALYRRMGFSRLGTPAQSGSARFIPMIAEIARFPDNIKRDIERWGRSVAAGTNGETGNGRPSNGSARAEPLSLTPGPAAIPEEVRRAFRLPPISHRGRQFLDLFAKVRRSLGELVGGAEVALFPGSGTLANDVVAATLASERGLGPGLVLVNGEFGERLARHATGAGLEFRVLRWEWGRPWDLDQVAAQLERARWVWGVHLESSTGLVNDLPALIRMARDRGARVVADCVSSLGAVPLELGEVHLATGVAGKSLGGFAGISMVFCPRGVADRMVRRRVAPSLDLKGALALEGPRFTFPSSCLLALSAALDRYSTAERAGSIYGHYRSLGRLVREKLLQAGIRPLVEGKEASPVITTFSPPGGLGSEPFVALCRSWGYDVGGLSGYLEERRLAQIATMGQVSPEDCEPLFTRLKTEFLESNDGRR